MHIKNLFLNKVKKKKTHLVKMNNLLTMFYNFVCIIRFDYD
jgi:hypothetical protein